MLHTCISFCCRFLLIFLRKTLIVKNKIAFIHCYHIDNHRIKRFIFGDFLGRISYWVETWFRFILLFGALFADPGSRPQQEVVISGHRGRDMWADCDTRDHRVQETLGRKTQIWLGNMLTSLSNLLRSDLPWQAE